MRDGVLLLRPPLARSRVHRIIPFYTGAIPGETPLAMKRRPKMFLKSRPGPQVRRGTAPPLEKVLSLSKGQTDGCQLFDTGTLYVRTVPASFRFASLGGVFAIRLSHPSTPSVRVAPGGSEEALATSPPQVNDHDPPESQLCAPRPGPAGAGGSTAPPPPPPRAGPRDKNRDPHVSSSSSRCNQGAPPGASPSRGREPG